MLFCDMFLSGILRPAQDLRAVVVLVAWTWRTVLGVAGLLSCASYVFRGVLGELCAVNVLDSNTYGMACVDLRNFKWPENNAYRLLWEPTPLSERGCAQRIDMAADSPTKTSREVVPTECIVSMSGDLGHGFAEPGDHRPACMSTIPSIRTSRTRATLFGTLSATFAETVDPHQLISSSRLPSQPPPQPPPSRLSKAKLCRRTNINTKPSLLFL